MKSYFQKIRWQIFILTILIMTFSPLQTMALEVATHRAINEINAAKGSFLHQYLINQLGMKNGVETEINKKWIIKYISDGGEEEDAGVRCFNHFLNPITNQGLIGQYSAVAWVTLPVGVQPLSPISSWNDVRDYYLKALTSSDKTTRDNYFALTFQGMGQIMHLVEDMSVSAHVRLDIHPPPFWNDDYENWAKTNIKDATQVGTYSVSTFTPNDYSFLIPQLFDTDQYNGSNPTSASNIGLSEYTNANFLSQGTIFTANFLYPAYSDMSPKVETDSTSGKQILYLSKNGHGESVEYFARAGSLYNYLPADYKKLALTLDDDKVHVNYAHFLIPRAIGYSSQVLNYFFRGQLEVEMGAGSLKVKNTSNETMTGGKFELYYDDPNGSRANLTTSLVTELSHGTEQIIPFNAPQDATSYMLVYRGQMGGEAGVVIGKFIPAELVVITVSLRGISGENLTKKSVLVWNPVGNSLERAPVDYDDSDFQKWYQSKTTTGEDMFSFQGSCGLGYPNFGTPDLYGHYALTTQPSKCPYLTQGMMDTSVWGLPSVIEYKTYVNDGYGNTGTQVASQTENYGHDIQAMGNNNGVQYPVSNYYLVQLPGSPTIHTGFRTHQVYENVYSFVASEICNYPDSSCTPGHYKGWTRLYVENVKDIYYAPLGSETVSLIESTYEDKWIASVGETIKRIYKNAVYARIYENNRNFPGWGYSLSGKYDDNVIADVCFIQYTPCSGKQEYYNNQQTINEETRESRVYIIQAQVLSVPQGTTGYNWVAAGRNATLEAQIIAAINMAYSLNGIPVNEIRSTSIDISIVK